MFFKYIIHKPAYIYNIDFKFVFKNFTSSTAQKNAMRPAVSCGTHGRQIAGYLENMIFSLLNICVKTSAAIKEHIKLLTIVTIVFGIE